MELKHIFSLRNNIFFYLKFCQEILTNDEIFRNSLLACLFNDESLLRSHDWSVSEMSQGLANDAIKKLPAAAAGGGGGGAAARGAGEGDPPRPPNIPRPPRPILEKK